MSGVPPQHQDGLFVSLRNHLDEKPWVLTATTILIEKQPGMNKTMKTVENFLHSYFVIKNPNAETIIYDARHKVPDIAGAGKAKYRQRKKAAVDRCRTFLETSEINKHWMATFVASKKKDDLADCYLQALTYCIFEKLIIPGNTENPGNVKITVKEILTKVEIKKRLKELILSKSNILEIINGVPQILKDSIENKFTIQFPLDLTGVELLFSNNNIKSYIKKVLLLL